MRLLRTTAVWPTLVLAALLGVGLSGTLHAQVTPRDDRWQFVVSPYLLAPSMTGSDPGFVYDMRIFGPELGLVFHF